MNLDKLEAAERKALKTTKTVVKDKKALMDWLFSGPSTQASPVEKKEVKVKERKNYINSEEYSLTGNEKKCRCCFEVKDISEYRLHPSTIDGYNGQCKKCIDTKRMELYHSKEELYTFHVENNSKFTCNKCNIEKVCTEFGRYLTFSEGFNKTCRECERG